MKIQVILKHWGTYYKTIEYDFQAISKYTSAIHKGSVYAYYKIVVFCYYKYNHDASCAMALEYGELFIEKSKNIDKLNIFADRIYSVLGALYSYDYFNFKKALYYIEKINNKKNQISLLENLYKKAKKPDNIIELYSKGHDIDLSDYFSIFNNTQMLYTYEIYDKIRNILFDKNIKMINEKRYCEIYIGKTDIDEQIRNLVIEKLETMACILLETLPKDLIDIIILY